MLMTGTDNHVAGLGTMHELLTPEQIGRKELVPLELLSPEQGRQCVPREPTGVVQEGR